MAAGKSGKEFVQIALENLSTKGRPYFEKFVREELVKEGKMQEELKNLPAPRYWMKARLKWMLHFEPNLMWDKFQNNPKALLQELKEKAQQAVKYRRELQKKGNLADDQISEIVQNMIAPTEGNPPKPLPEEEELKIREWFERQFY